MKKLISAICFMAATALTGCFDTTEETTINEDGSGNLITTLDMGNIIRLAKMAGGDKTEDLDKVSIDTVIKMSGFQDSIKNLSDAEKKVLVNATMRTVMNPAGEEMKMIYSFPYSNLAELITVNSVLKKVMYKTQGTIMEKLMKGGDDGKSMLGDEGEAMLGGEDMGFPDLNEYYTYSYADGKISKKLNKEKYAGVKDDKTLTSMQEMSQLGITMSMKAVYNLPRAAKKSEGKGVKLSADKKKLTVETTLDDFFDSPELLEYEIEY